MIILAADDDDEDFEFFHEAIKEIDQSIVVWKASDGIEALEILENTILEPDFVFLDINMPRMGGRECMQKIKRHERLKEVRVVMYSTTNNPTEIAQCKQLGASFLPKPYQFSKLVDSLRTILLEAKRS